MRKLLVANRGEIALRVFRACRELGIATVAVAPADDRGSLHARSADETLEISSYLEASEHIRAVEDSGDKLEAKRIAREAGVPVIPEGEPEEIGFPLMIKAAAGGGGRGMRVVRESAELEDALAAARREAKAAFGDDRVFCERYVEGPRHVEIQLLGDSHGEVIALGERECSVQRRHQKVLEEAPSPALDPELRDRMSAAAVAFARAIGYRSAGTVEFIVHGRDFWFLELNGRIQVEHAVTELVTGVDLVEAQLRIAQGEPVQVTDWYLDGHAVEVRLY